MKPTVYQTALLLSEDPAAGDHAPEPATSKFANNGPDCGTSLYPSEILPEGSN